MTEKPKAAPGQTAGQELALWAVLASAKDVGEYCQTWLAIQARMIEGVNGAMVLVRGVREGSYSPAAVWPDVRRDMAYLQGVAQKALTDRRGLVQPRNGPDGTLAGYSIGYPVQVEGRLRGAVVLDVSPRPEAELQAALRQLRWGASGLELVFMREEVTGEREAKNQLQAVLEIVAGSADHDRYAATAMALVTALATRLQCDRVSLGFVTRDRMRIDAISHSAQVKERTNLARAIAAAMDEAADQSAVVSFPPLEGSAPVILRAHEGLAHSQGSGAVCTFPLTAQGRVVGALTLERPAGRPFDRETLALCEALGALVGPMLEVYRREDRWFGARFASWAHEKLSHLFGPRHPGLKLATILVVAAAAFALLLHGDFRISASSVLEPLSQQAAVAPFNGYIREAPARAGDLVKAGAVLARLDDRELRLERLKWLSQQEELGKQLRAAMAERDASQVQIVSAQLDQAKAQVARADEQMSRTVIAAPFDGVVVSGDLTQRLGAPVERGTVLYEVAPMDGFRLILKIDERDVSYVKPGQRGTLLLSAFPNDPIGFEVTTVTPVSTPREGRNYFRVEAKLDRSDPRMRPNMEGVGKVDIGDARYIWIWTRQAFDSVRLLAWSWLP